MTVNKRYPHLFSELNVRGRVLKNRTVSGPMVLEWSMDKNGFLNDLGIKAFGSFAEGGVGMVTLGEGKIDDLNSRAHNHHYECRDADVITRYHLFTEYVHAYGALASIEFNHNGMHALPEFNPGHLGPMGPVDIDMPSGIHVRAMTKEDMDQVSESYAQATLIAKRSGFDAVCLHFAHGWLLSAFLSSQINTRTDEYGGSLENKMRFPLQILHRIRAVVGDNILIELRLNGSDYTDGGIEIEEAVEMVKLFEKDGSVDMIHMSCGTRMDNRTRPISMSSHFVEAGHNVKFAEAVKRAGVKMPIGVVGGINDPQFIEDIIASGKADYVVAARQFLADPEWVNKAKHGEEKDIRKCMRCQHCMDTNRVNNAKNVKAVMEDWKGTKIHLCDLNPTWGHGAMIGQIPAPGKKRKVVVVGGGIAGVNAAIKADELGHEVILFEQSKQIGGLLKLYAEPVWFKQGEFEYLKYLRRQLEKSGVEVHLGERATPDMVEALNPDTVIVAVGGKADHRGIPVETGSKTIDVLGVYFHEASLGKKVVIIGGNTSGCEAAIHLAGKDIEVTLLEKGDSLLPDEGVSYRLHTIQHLDEAESIKYYEETEVTRIVAGGVRARNTATGEETFYEADTVIFATGMTPKIDEYRKFENTAIDVVNVGDSRKIGTIGTATHEGYNAAVTVYAK
ncbi:MAG: FAD-dependent oxidoreductase [Lachnospiraceae bacterium]|nr:FAD-dependent oxidoreductase [Lachnospiraceae bacterium]